MNDGGIWMEERKTYTDEELSAVLEKHRVMLAVGTFIMYAAVAVILGGTSDFSLHLWELS